MKIIPAKSQAWWDLSFLPFKTYVLLAPIGFFVWKIATEGSRVRGTWEYAAGLIGIGYMVSFLILLIGGLFVWCVRHFDAAAKCFFFMLLAFLFSFFIASRADPFAVAISIFMIGIQFVNHRPAPKAFEFNHTQAFDCPACQALILGSEQKCPRCGWTYLVQQPTPITGA